MIDVQMGRRGLFILMTIQAIYRILIGIGDDHGHSGASRCGRVDVAIGVMALHAAACLVDSEYLSKGANRVTVGTRL